MREGVPFSLKSIEDIITEEKEELLSLIYEEVEDDVIELNLILKFNQWQNSQKRNMEKMNLVIERFILCMALMNMQIKNIDYVLDKAVEEIQEDIDEDNDKDSIIGIQAFHFELVIIEVIYYLHNFNDNIIRVMGL